MEVELKVVEKLSNVYTQEGVVITNDAGMIIAVSERILTATGYTHEQVVGQSFRALLTHPSLTLNYEAIWAHVQTYKGWKGEIRMVLPNGTYHRKQVTVDSVWCERKKGMLYVWQFVDVPEAECIVEAVYKASTVAIIKLDVEMNVRHWNEAAEQLFGWKKEEIIDQPLFSLLQCHPSYMLSMFQQTAQGDPLRFECTAKRKDGTVVHIACSALAISSGGAITGYIAMISDITKVRQKELEHRKQLELAKKIQQSVLTPVIQHDTITMDAIYIPSEELSGDLYACYQIDDHRFGMMIIDVIGHGLSSSLVSMSLRSLLRGLILRVVDPVSVALELEKHLQNLFPERELDMHYLFSMIYLVVDMKQQKIEYINAGHPFGLMLTDNGEMIELDKGGLAIGSPFSVPFEKGVVHFNKRTRLFLYTDGILDEIDSSILTSITKIRHFLKNYHNLPDQQFLRLLVDHHVRQPHPADDICLLSITIQGW
ncbi:SpoIIE family protein phosphatase [Anoxybacillus sp. J5B_2022]|uniref:SpoIIE family protein phosphatase n=1 Tax=Anoxybacillus sp. J5B_2022 TaxID=3003246 RepID=UPI0022863E59|nr:SpoIIE family protein phosphatase [Anoxybacillus sp. J5B_2022]MCZ0755896.1 SpoIIE family protein phosphatase [Anoxybacillus sp. J5B_2022]